MAKNRRVTIRDIAREAGVSTQTVSRVLNERPDVAPETRQQIQNLIKQYNFRPSAIARSLARNRSMTLGYVGPGFSVIGFFRTLGGITQEADRLGYSILFTQLPVLDKESISAVINKMNTNQVDGIIWNIPQIGDKDFWLDIVREQQDLPSVFLSLEPTEGFSTLTIDAFSVGQIAVEHLLNQGFCRIGHISGPLDWWLARERKRGWEEALKKAGLDVLPTHSAESDWSPIGGRRAIRQLLHSYPAIDAVFAANDHIALGVLHEAHSLGIRIPDDLGVVGYDNLPETESYWPPLTSIEQDQPEFGRKAIRELDRIITATRIDGVLPPPVTTQMPVTLVPRQSSTRNRS